MTKYLVRFTVLFLIVSLVSCVSEEKGSNKNDGINDAQVDSLKEGQIRKVTKIFYNVPSPIEMSSIIQRAGSYYNEDLLNPLHNKDNYTTNAKMALNLGVYGADLSYARLFDQIQISIDYLALIKKLTEKLGIPEDQGAFAVSRIQEHMENRDTLLQIIADTYSSTDSYLKENGRESTAVLVLIGGWVEGLYFSLHMIDEENPNKEIMERVAEQKYSLNNMIELVKDYQSDENVKQFLEKLENLRLAFDGIEINYTLNDVKTDKENHITTIDSKTEIKVSIEDIKKINNIVIGIRNEIIE